MSDKINRRNFIQKSAALGAGMAAIPGSTFAAPAVNRSGRPRAKLNIGVIGAGLRGQSHIDMLLNRDDCEVPAICDIDQEMVNRALVI